MTTLTTIASTLVLLICFASRPRGATCPDGWWLAKGVDRHGDFACRPKPVGDDAKDSRGVLVDHSVQPPGELHGRIYCEPNAIPTIVPDSQSVACSRGHYDE